MTSFGVIDASQTFFVDPEAAKKAATLMKVGSEPEGTAVRVAVRPGGCSGFSYEMFFDTDIATDDHKIVQDGVTVVIDPASFKMLGGATLKYRDGLQGAGFTIDNPNAQRSCGCGQSFS